jgi:hypothetical protein
MDYQTNEISYCVNHKGQKIKPYKSNHTPVKKSFLEKYRTEILVGCGMITIILLVILKSV